MNTPRTDKVSNQCDTDCYDAAKDAYQAMKKHAERLEDDDHVNQIIKERDDARREAEEFRDDMNVHLTEGDGKFTWENTKDNHE
tara:strand:- start:228 stop:479 length:252 start_codon:yes stop_codon:yes gene_type:complete